MNTRDMEEKPQDPICESALLRAGGGEHRANQVRAAQQLKQER